MSGTGWQPEITTRNQRANRGTRRCVTASTRTSAAAVQYRPLSGPAAGGNGIQDRETELLSPESSPAGSR